MLPPFPPRRPGRDQEYPPGIRGGRVGALTACPATWISRTLGSIVFASKRGSPVPIVRLLSAPLCIVVFAATLSSAGWAKDTGLVFVSNEKTNNLIVIDPKTNKVVK